MELSIKERPILFSAPMVRAINEGRKTQTRRVAKYTARLPIDFVGGRGDWNDPQAWGFEDSDGKWWTLKGGDGNIEIPCPYGKSGDRLWVRENLAFSRLYDLMSPSEVPVGSDVYYQASMTEQEFYELHSKTRPSIFMPRWASRITLEITDVRVERLNEISNKDAMAEGIVQTWGDFGSEPPKWAADSISNHGEASGSHIYDNRTSAENFQFLWESINGAGSWALNPWVWAVEFKRVTA